MDEKNNLEFFDRNFEIRAVIGMKEGRLCDTIGFRAPPSRIRSKIRPK